MQRETRLRRAHRMVARCIVLLVLVLTIRLVLEQHRLARVVALMRVINDCSLFLCIYLLDGSKIRMMPTTRLLHTNLEAFFAIVPRQV